MYVSNSQLRTDTRDNVSEQMRGGLHWYYVRILFGTGVSSGETCGAQPTTEAD